MAPGFLAVFSEPGAQVTLDEFQDWYDNEHVPLRLNHLSSFLTGARLSSLDKQKPSWLAVYDVSSTSVFSDDSYTRLRANRSPREAHLVQRLDILDRRTCELIYDSGENESKSMSWKSWKAGEQATAVAVTHGLEGNDVNKWAKEASVQLNTLPEWVRTRAYKTFDSLKTGLGVPPGPEAQNVPEFLVVHEFMDSNVFESGAYKQVVSTAGVVDVRYWGLYRAFPGLAQGNLRVV